MPYNHIGIVGLGLIGGSIYNCLSERFSHIKVTKIAQKTEHDRFNELITGVDLLIIATPLSQIIPVARSIVSQKKPMVIIDVGSVKELITKEFEALSSESLEFLSTHPMAGKETSGYENSEADLFKNRSWAITPHSKNLPATIEAIETFIRQLGATPLILSPSEHDRYAALVSHLPAILARGYDSFVRKIAPNALKLAGPGYASFTRLAHDNPELRSEIESLNQKSIDTYLKLWKETL